MELNKYIFPLRKWWWLLVASTLIATIFSTLSTLRQPKVYQARTTLIQARFDLRVARAQLESLIGREL